LTVYHYYLSVMNTAGVAYPEINQIREDLGLRDLSTIRVSQRRLVQFGFLIEPIDEDRKAYPLMERPIYQRPCIQYTIRELLARELIDGELYPRSNIIRTPLRKQSDSVVEAGIRHMLGDEAHKAYKVAFDAADDEREARLTAVLTRLLDEDLARKVEAESARKAATKQAAFSAEDLGDVSPEIKELFFGVTEAQPQPATKRRKRSRTARA